MRFLIEWLLGAVALLFVAYLHPGVELRGFASAPGAALVIGLLNPVVRPVPALLTLPVTVLTLGLFLFVINALIFWPASGLPGGFAVAGFGAALAGSLLHALLGVAIEAALGGLLNRSG